MKTVISAFFVATYNVANRDLFSEYQKVALPMLKKYKCKALTLGTSIVDGIIEGDQLEMTVVLEFPSKEEAQAWYRSDEYQRILPMRLTSVSNARSVIVEGLPPAYPFSFTATRGIWKKDGESIMELARLIAEGIGPHITVGEKVGVDTRWTASSSVRIADEANKRMVYLYLNHGEASLYVYFLSYQNPGITAENAKQYFEVNPANYSHEPVGITQELVDLLQKEIAHYFKTGVRAY